MIRTVLFRVDASGEWLEGAVHGFQGENCIVENLATAELNLVPVKPGHLKFKVNSNDWIKMQIQAQQAAQQQANSRAITAPSITEVRGLGR